MPPSSCHCATDVEPIVGQHLAARDFLANAIDENLRPAAGQAAEAGRFQSLEHRAERQLRELVQRVNFRRREGVHVHLRKASL